MSAIARGATAKAAAEAAGVDEATFYRWLERARDGRRPYVGFARRVAAARVRYEASVEEAFRRRREAWRREAEARSELALQAVLARLRL